MPLLLGALAQTTMVWLSACTSIDHSAACNHFLVVATSASAAHDYARAQEALSKAAREAEVSDDPAQKRRVLRQQAETFLCRQNPVAAEATARQLIKIYDGTSEKKLSTSLRSDLADDRSRARIILSDALLAQKQPDRAASVLEDARKELANVCGEPVLSANIDDRYVAALRATGRAANSPGISAEADTLSQQEADGLVGEALKLQVKGQYEEAIVLLKKAQQAAIRSGSEEVYVRATFELACTDYLLNHATAAYELALKAADKARSNKVKSYIKSAALAVVALTAADPHKAVEALLAASSADPERAFMTLSKVAGMHSQRPFAARVRECDLMWSMAPRARDSDRFQAIVLRCDLFSDHKTNRAPAIAWFLEHGKSSLLHPYERILCYELAAGLCHADNRFAEEKQYARQAVHLREQLQLKESDFFDREGAVYRLAEDYTTLGRSQEAIALAQHCLTLYPTNLAMAGRLMALIETNYRNEHQYQKAIESYDKALVLFRKANVPMSQDFLAERAQLVAQLDAQGKH